MANLPSRQALVTRILRGRPDLRRWQMEHPASWALVDQTAARLYDQGEPFAAAFRTVKLAELCRRMGDDATRAALAVPCCRVAS